MTRQGLERYRAYYTALPRGDDLRGIRRVATGAWRSEAGWAFRWLAARRSWSPFGDPPRVLDAGCGFGTEALMFASLGIPVEGVDIRPDRLAVAAARAQNYAETQGAIDLRFSRRDLTIEWPGDVDLVWVYNALSHIDPPERFLLRARRHLRPGGVIVIGDINGAHPGHRRRLSRLRQQVHQEYVAKDGRRHRYAVEATFSAEDLRRLLQRNGFRVLRHELFVGGMSRVPEGVFRLLVRPVQNQRLLTSTIARRQLVVATPA